MKSEQPYFSIVIPTIHRTAAVEALLGSISQSTFHSYEVLVVDQNQDRRLDAICKKFQQVMHLKHYRVDFKGASRARNYGAARASGYVLNFPDDDCEYFEHLLANAHRLFEEKGLSCLTGSCVNRDGKSSATKFYDDELYLSVKTMWGRLIECTIFIQSSLFFDLCGFDEWFGVGSDFGADEGPELVVRLFKQKPTPIVYFCSDIRFYHPEKVLTYNFETQQRAYSYARGSGALFRKWPREVAGYYVVWFSKSLLGSLMYWGNKRRFYWNRVLGFLDGMREYGKRNFD